MSLRTKIELPHLALIDPNSTSSTRSAISIQLNDSLEKTRLILQNWRDRSSHLASYDDSTRVSQFTDLSSDKFHRHSSIPISRPEFHEDDTIISDLGGHPSSSQSFDDDDEMKDDDDDETKTLASVSSGLITRKREKKNAALSKLQGMLSMISASQSDEIVRQNMTFASTSLESSSDIVKARLGSPTYSLTFSESTNAEKSRAKKERKTAENSKVRN